MKIHSIKKPDREAEDKCISRGYYKWAQGLQVDKVASSKELGM